MLQTVETIIKKLTKNPIKYWTSVTEVPTLGVKEVRFNYPIKIKIVLRMLSTTLDKWNLKIEPEHLQPIDIQMSEDEALHIINLIEDLKEACVKGTREYLTNIILSL
jgi:hypothetical protein